MSHQPPKVVQVGAVREPYRSLSRSAMSVWFMPYVGRRQSLAELSTGFIYALLLDLLFPGCVDKKKLKEEPRDDLEKTQNWMVILRGMDRLKIDKRIDVPQLIKATSVAGFEFARWFMAFFDANNNNNHQQEEPVVSEEEIAPRMDTPVRRRSVEPHFHAQLDEVMEEEEDEDEPEVKMEVKWEEKEEEEREQPVEQQPVEEEPENEQQRIKEELEEEEEPMVDAVPMPARIWSEVAAAEQMMTPDNAVKKKKVDTPPFTMILRSSDKKI